MEALPVGQGFVDFAAGLTPTAAVASVEAGWHPVTGWALFGTGKVLQPWQGRASGYLGIGVRGRW